MECNKCGRQLSETETDCPYCKAESQPVHILTPEERQDFKGVTIEQDSDNRYSDTQYERSQYSANERIFVRQVKFNSLSGGWFSKLVWGVILAGIVMFAFSSLFVVALVGAIAWLIIRIFR